MIVEVETRALAGDQDYYARRAAAARRSAERADDPHIRAIHLGMAARYDALCGPQAAAGLVARRIEDAADHLTDALLILDEEGRLVEAAYVSTALEMLGTGGAA